MKPLLRFSVSLLVLGALLKICQAQCSNVIGCTSIDTKNLTVTTTTVTFVSDLTCSLSTGNITSNGVISNLTPGAVYPIVFGCFNCCTDVTTKPEAVGNLAVTSVTTSSVFVTWTEPNGNSSAYRVRWNNGNNRTVTGTSTNITGLTAGVQYNINVTAVADDELTEGETDTVSNYTKPEAVGNLRVSEFTTSSVYLMWTEPEGNRSFYRVEWTNGTTNWADSVTDTEMNVTGLTAGVQYTFTVIAVAGDTTTESAVAQISHYTKPEAVSNLAVTNIMTSSLYLTWTEPQGRSSFYRVNWTDGNISDSENVNQTHINITNLTAGVQYNISVTAVAGDGLTEGQSTFITQYTRPGKIGVPTVSTTTTSISLNWTKPPGEVFKYKVEWNNGGSQMVKYTDNTSAVLSDLIPGTTYTITVIAVAGDDQTKGDGQTLTSVTKPEAVRNPTVTNITTSSVFLIWTEPSGNISFFRVNWTDGNVSDSENVYQTHINITNLIAGVQYNISVTAVAGDGLTEGQSTFITRYTRPNKIEVPTVSTTTISITLTWTKPPGEVFKYRVEWNNGGSQMVEYTDNTSAVLSPLIPGTTYTITVIAVAGDDQTEGDGQTLTSVTKPEAVRNPTVTIITTSSVFLTWTEPEGNISFCRVNWTDGNVSDSENVNQTHINIINLTAGVQYNISVTAVADDGLTEGQSIPVTRYTRPEVVRNLTVANITASSISLMWTEPEGNRSFYRVQWTNGTTNWNNSVTDNKMNVTGLTAGVQYTFTVIAVAGDNTTESEMAQISHYTRPGKIGVPTVSTTTISISLNWTKPPGEVFKYRVEWNNGGALMSMLTTVTSAELSPLIPGTTYTITVIAVAGDDQTEGDGQTLTSVTKPEAVRNPTVTNITTSSVFLTWTEPLGNISFYRVNWTDGYFSDSENVNQTHINITNLTAGVQYNISVTAVADDERTEGQSQSVTRYTRPEVVRNLTVANITTSSISLMWTEPEGNRSFYRVQWTNGTTNWKNIVTDNKMNVTGLTAGVQYNITVIAVAGDNTTESEMAQISQYTRPGKIGVPTVSTTTTSISLNWTKPPGEVFMYRVEWNNGGSQMVKYTDNIAAVLSPLIPGTTYTITVIAVAGDNQTEGDGQTLTSVTKPEAVRNPTVTNITTSSVFLTWTEPLGNISFYRVNWTDGNVRDSENVNQTHINITNLTAGVQYNITVTAVADDGLTEGQSQSVTRYTRPEVVRNLTVANITTSSISLMWTEPEGNRSFYRVQWTNGTTNWNNSVTDNKMNVTGLTAGVQYNFTVIAVAGDNTTESEMAQISHYTRPGKIGVPTVSTTTISISLNWTKPPGEVFKYRVEWNNGGALMSMLTSDTSAELSPLIPGTTYTITVIAVAGDDQTEGDGQTLTSVTKPEAVRNPTVTNITTSSVFLIWTEPLGNISFYRVNWTNGYFSDSENVNQTHINITNLTAGVQYNISVTAVADDERTEGQSKSVTRYTRPEVVRNLTVANITTSSISLMWTEPEGNRSFYRVQWTNGTTNWKNIVTDNKMNVTGLTAGVQYNFTVIAVAGDNTTESEMAQISHYTRPGKIGVPTVSTTTTSISLNWTKPPGEVFKYRVEWNNGGSQMVKYTENISAVLSPLIPGTTYTITVIAVAGDNQTEGDGQTLTSVTKPEAVRNPTVTNITTSSVFLTWTEPLGNISFYRVNWTDGNVRDSENVNQTHINITNLTAGVQYNISVTAVADDGLTEGQSQSVTRYTRPEVVRNLTVANITTSSISLMWTEPEGNRSFYRVQWTNGTTNWKNIVTDNKMNVTGLTAGVQYNFTVIAVAGDNTTESEMAQISHYTSKMMSYIFAHESIYVTDVLYHLVRSSCLLYSLGPGKIAVPTVSTTTTSISLNWTKPPGEVFKYRVEWNNGGALMSMLTSDTSAELSPLIPGTTYTITVIAVAGDNQTEGDGQTLTSVTKPEAVRNTTVTNITTSSVFLTWTEPLGNISFYRVNWTDGYFSDSENVTQIHINITNLTAGVQYNISVTAVADDERTEGQSKSVFQYTRPEAVRNLKVTEITTSSISLMWTEPEGDRSFYRVQWTNGTTNWVDSVTDTEMNVTGLTAGVQYNFTVIAVAGDNTTESEMAQISHYTRPGKIGVPTVSTTTTSISLNWTKPPGEVFKYRVEWNNGGSQMVKYTDNISAELLPLIPGTTYTITVIAVAGDNQTEGDGQTLTSVTKPEAVRNPTVTNITTSSVFLTWTEPLGNISFYRVTWTDGYFSDSENVNQTHINITNLTAGVQYNISVTAVADDERTEGQSKSVFQYTRPEAVRNLNVTEITTSSISLMWTEPEGNRSFYRVQWTNGTTNWVDSVTDTEMNVTGLTAGVQYNFTVIAVAGDNTTESEMAQISHYTRPGKIGVPTVSTTTTSISLNWTKPPGEVFKYRVEWNNGGSQMVKYTDNTSAELLPLIPGTTYTITVIAVAGDNQTEGDGQTLTSVTKPEAVRNPTVTNITTSSVFLIWTEPLGNISFYRVNWTDGYFSDSENVNQTHINITNLTAGVQYNISVTAVADDERTEGQSKAVFQYTRPEAVRNLNVTEITTSSISLMWTEPEGNRSFYRVQWTNGTTNWADSVTDTEMNVTGLTAGVQYNFTVIAVAGDNTTESAVAQISHYTKPEAVSNLAVSNITASSLYLTWTEPRGRSSFYRVNWTDGNISDSENVNQTHINIINLIAGVQYNISVTAVAGDGLTEGQSTFITQYTRPNKIEVPTVSTTTTSISLNWTKPPGEVFKYKVEWNNGGSQMFTYTDNTSAVLSPLIPGNEYTIAITAIAGDNEPGEPNTFTSVTVPAVVRNPTITDVTTSSVSLHWDKPEGNATGYIVQWTLGEDTFNDTTTDTSFTINGLIPGSRYNITVSAVAVNPSNEGERTLRTTFTRPDMPEDITITARGTNYLNISWTLRQGGFELYVVNISNQDLAFSGSTTTTDNTTNFAGLRPGRLFDIAVTAVAGDFSNTSYLSAATIPTPPRSFTISHPTNSSLRLQWATPDLMDGAPDTSYRVTYQPTDGNVQNRNPTTNNTELSMLSSGTSYNITVQTVGPQNQMSSVVHNSSFTLPNPVLNLEASPESTTSIKVQWSNPQGAQQYYTYMVVTYKDMGTPSEVSASSNSTNVGRLEPGTRYSVNVTTIAAPGSESTVEHTFSYTMPKAVTNLKVAAVNTTAIQLTWSRQTDHKSSYSYRVVVLHHDMVVQNASTGTETYTFSNLTPGECYTFKVFTVVGGVHSSVATTQSFTTPDVVSDITVLGSTTTLSVSWTRAGGRVDSYTVNLYRDNQLMKNHSNLSNNTQSTEFLNQKPGVNYCVQVVTHSGNFENNRTECNATFPNPPGPITVQSQTVNSITFTWPLPDGMDHRQYNFSVSHINGSSLIENNSFLLDNLQSGSPYSISVVTVGVRDYESTAVTTENYTRPYPVTMLRQSEISTDAVTLVWEQPQSKPHYSFMVQTSNGSNFAPLFRSNTTVTIPGLLSGSNYSFTVTTLTADGTQSEPVTVSYFTRPFSVTGLKAETLSTTAVRLSWNRPPEYKPGYTYQVNTTGCGSKNTNLPGEVAEISALTPGTECTFCVFVRAADGIEGEANCTSQYTKPETVQPSASSQGSNSSILVSWTKPPGRVERYMVRLNGSSSQEQNLSSLDTSRLFEGLSAGRLYSVMITTFSGPFNAPSGFVTNATFPNPPGAIEVLSKTTGSIDIRWQEAPLMTGASFQYRCIIPTQGGENVPSTSTRHNFTSLLSGTPYNISVSTVGPMGFESEEVQIHKVTTRPFTVRNLSTSTEERSITVMWDTPDQYKDSYRFNVTWQRSNGPRSVVVAETQYKVPDLVPGSSYDITVTTETSDGTEGAPTPISECTNASPVKDLTCNGPNTPNAEVNLSWNNPDGKYSGFQVAVNNQIINATSSCCAQTVSNLSHFTEYHLTVKSLSCGQPSTATNLSCTTGITDPPVIPESDADKLVMETEKSYNKFTIQVETKLLTNTSGPITHVGVLMTNNLPGNTSNWRNYLEKTYNQWKEGSTQVYLATVTKIALSRSVATHLNIEIGDGSKFLDYTNGALSANGKYQYAIVLFTNLQDNSMLVNGTRSLVSTTHFFTVVLPSNPAVTAIAIGVTLGIFCVLFIILIGFIIYWRRLNNKESSDIQIHAIRMIIYHMLHNMNRLNCTDKTRDSCLTSGVHLSRSVAVRVEDYEAYYRRQKADSNCGFAEEFEDLKLVGTGQAKTNALTLENKPKNRYNNVLPYDSSRVKLSIVHGSPYDDYINANYMPGYNSRKEFIAAQGPLPTTVDEFWRMVWEKNVQTLVMLTRCNEQGRVKCEQYWDSGTKIYGDITVTTTSEIPLEDWTIRDFDIKNVKTAETRSVRHFHFTAWPDHGVPETTELLISFRHLVREHMNQYSRHSPTVVHCSAGVGRTGTFIAIDRLLFQIERENIVDVYGIVHDLRMHRPLMVQTEDQYVFLNQCAMDIIRSRTGTNVDLIYQNTAALSIYDNVEPKGYGKNGYNNA
ncbi:uncharacterized protein [Pagrus major]|uniref:uncharacterized protein n=1 Tax=Pagrus major TaxID=143350 RepID=UPI003CC88216